MPHNTFLFSNIVIRNASCARKPLHFYWQEPASEQWRSPTSAPKLHLIWRSSINSAMSEKSEKIVEKRDIMNDSCEELYKWALDEHESLAKDLTRPKTSSYIVLTLFKNGWDLLTEAERNYQSVSASLAQYVNISDILSRWILQMKIEANTDQKNQPNAGGMWLSSSQEYTPLGNPTWHSYPSMWAEKWRLKENQYS